MSDLLAARRRWLLRMAAALALPPALSPTLAAHDASERLLPSSSDLQQDLATALARQEPLVVMATLHGCPFCRVVREHHLLPLQRAGALVTQIHFLSRAPLRDMSGAQTTHGALVRQLGIEVAPTVLFHGTGQREVAERLAGSSIPDFYGAYLDDRLAQARAVVRGR
ncbi:hypothetical protein [Pantoea sp. 18069]|uniref:hypothetical protein n=1 Tax=Pantoea sp. 18069 TaxID=2681415 RepID=UPI001358AC5F|nr:hypothetical protein [Pantoea sp. 18069]